MTSERPKPRKRPQRRLMPAGHVIMVVYIALILGLLFNARDIQATAERQPFGWQRSVGLALTRPVVAVSETLGIDTPRTAIDIALGRQVAPGAAPAVAAGSSPSPSATVPPPDATGPAAATAPATEAPRSSAGASAPDPRPPQRRSVSASDPLRMFIGGDSMVGQFGPALGNRVDATGAVEAEVQYEFISGLSRPDFFDWPARLAAVSETMDPDVVVLFFGGNDAQNIRRGDEILEFGTKAWRAEYRRRVEAVMADLTSAGTHVVWIGMPVVASADFQQRVDLMNEIYRSAAEQYPGVTFVDSDPVFSGPDGTYSEYLVDDSGAQTDMRLNDGVHLTTAGGQRLADRVFELLAEQWDLPEPSGITS